MKKVLFFMLLLTYGLLAKDLGEVMGIPFGMSISKIKKIKGVRCSKMDDKVTTLCEVGSQDDYGDDRQHIIDEKRIGQIYFYFNEKGKLYGLKFFTPEKMYLPEFKESSEKEFNNLKDFIYSLPTPSSKEVYIGDPQLTVHPMRKHNYWFSRFYANEQMYDAVDELVKKKKEEQEKNDKTKVKNLKAKF